MSPRLHGVLLYLRCRSVPVTLLAFLAAGAVLRLASGADSPRAAEMTGQAVVVVAAALTARTFAGPDPDLERTAALPWPLVRALHLILLGGVLLGLLAAARHLGDPASAASGPLLQQVAGLVALTALAAALLGARAAWAPAVGWGLLMMTAGPRPSAAGQVLTWMVQDPATPASTVTCAVLTVLGAGAYLGRGSA